MAALTETGAAASETNGLKDSNSPSRAATKLSANGNESTSKIKILILSSSLLVDRVLLYTSLLSRLKKLGETRIWAASAGTNGASSPWSYVDAPVEGFPPVSAFKEFPYNYFKRLNEFAWDYRLRPPSRLSIQRHVRNKRQRFRIRLLKPLAFVLAKLRAENFLEAKVQFL
jgi:hypothetical protein